MQIFHYSTFDLLYHQLPLAHELSQYKHYNESREQNYLHLHVFHEVYALPANETPRFARKVSYAFPIEERLPTDCREVEDHDMIGGDF